MTVGSPVRAEVQCVDLWERKLPSVFNLLANQSAALSQNQFHHGLHLTINW